VKETKKGVTTLFIVLYQHLAAETEDKYEMPQSKFPVFKPRFDPWTSRVGNRNWTCLKASFVYWVPIPSHVSGFLFVTSVFREPVGPKQRVIEISTVYAGDAVNWGSAPQQLMFLFYYSCQKLQNLCLGKQRFL
jgi:hypothetical protein